MSYTSNSDSGLFGLLVIGGICLAMLAGTCLNYSGANQTAAKQNAVKFAKELNKAGTDAKLLHCDKHDSDGDGYVSCAFMFDGQPHTWECAGQSYIQANTGCREPKLSLRGGN